MIYVNKQKEMKWWILYFFYLMCFVFYGIYGIWKIKYIMQWRYQRSLLEEKLIVISDEGLANDDILC